MTVPGLVMLLSITVPVLAHCPLSLTVSALLRSCPHSLSALLHLLQLTPQEDGNLELKYVLLQDDSEAQPLQSNPPPKTAMPQQVWLHFLAAAAHSCGQPFLRRERRVVNTVLPSCVPTPAVLWRCARSARFSAGR
jgi:hypothetical protein